jgi:hypothetical protein
LCLWVGSPEQALKNVFAPITFEKGYDWYQKRQNFMLVSKIQTYLSDKMHLKKISIQNYTKNGGFIVQMAIGLRSSLNEDTTFQRTRDSLLA